MPGDVRNLRAVHVKDYAINTYSTNRNSICVVPVLKDLKDTGLVMNHWAGALRSMGDHSDR